MSIQTIRRGAIIAGSGGNQASSIAYEKINKNFLDLDTRVDELDSDLIAETSRVDTIMDSYVVSVNGETGEIFVGTQLVDDEVVDEEFAWSSKKVSERFIDLESSLSLDFSEDYYTASGNPTLGTMGERDVFISTSAPDDALGSDGDIWIQYTGE